MSSSATAVTAMTERRDGTPNRIPEIAGTVTTTPTCGEASA